MVVPLRVTVRKAVGGEKGRDVRGEIPVNVWVQRESDEMRRRSDHDNTAYDNLMND